MKQLLLSLSGILLIVFLPHFSGTPMFVFIPVLLIIIWLLLKSNKESFSNLGFSFNRFTFKAVWVGAVSAIILFAFLQYVFFPVLSKIVPLHQADLSDFSNIRHNPFNYIFFVLLGFIGGGFYEEIAFHGYIFTRFEKIFKGKYVLLISYILTNLIFGFYHWQLGASGIINALMAGLAYHAIMLKFNRNLWYAFFFHGFFDAIAFTYIFLGIW